MNKSWTCLYLLPIPMIGAYLTYHIYNQVTDWKFTIGFLGGAITIAFYQMVQNQLKCTNHSVMEQKED